LTLEEAIAHLEESLSDNSHEWGCEECKNEHVQLLGWLNELRERRSRDITPVVHCSECDNYYYADNRIPNQRAWTCSEYGDVSPDWFCGGGIKRKKGRENE
jgi:hypothetical protein